jgi:hypothetical protein
VTAFSRPPPAAYRPCSRRTAGGRDSRPTGPWRGSAPVRGHRCRPPRAGRSRPRAGHRVQWPRSSPAWSAPPGIEHRDHRLISKQPARSEQDLAQPRHHGRDLGSGVTNPERQGGAVQQHALTRHDLGLPIQGQVIGVAGDENVRDQRLGWQATLDQPRRRGGLHHRTRASPAGQLRPAGHDHPDLGGDDVEPLGFSGLRGLRPRSLELRRSASSPPGSTGRRSPVAPA